ncbi:MAG: glycosyltransferase [Oleiphilaceae bacterium]|nr:glycosyltransferase [Oleiphilaceae bacterium]
MNRRGILKLAFYLSLLVLVLGYKTYLNLFRPDFHSLHTEQLSAIESRLKGRDSYRFAVVGNINNSIGVFEKRMIPRLNQSGLDFLISAGNAVSGTGGEDKHRALHGTLQKLELPYLLTFGPHEFEGFGSFRFYEYYGPYHYSFRQDDSRFVFLDSTGKTDWQWQLKWLRELFSRNAAEHIFLFSAHPLLPVSLPAIFEDENSYLQPEAFREGLMALIQEYEVDAVFSANLPVYSDKTRHGTRFITTGGAGGLILNTQDSFYHYVSVTVENGRVGIEPVTLERSPGTVRRWLENLWFFIYSLFYVSFTNFLLILCALVALVIRLYNLVFVDRDYYPDYSIDPTPWLEPPLKVAMFTNNYLPFIGGVPISIERLKRGLSKLGNQLLIVAPLYPQHKEENSKDKQTQVLRLPNMLTMGIKGEFRMANIFQPGAWRRIRRFKPDIVHLHHPIWVGSLGLFLAKRLNVPAVYTYHTRLEHYAHFVPLPSVLFRNLISHALVRRFANKCDGVIVPTYSSEDYLRVIGVKSAIFVQPTGIEYQRFQRVDPGEVQALKASLGVNREEVTLISVCRLSNEKNIDFMIDAMAELRDNTEKPFQWLVIGEGHERERLQGRLEALGLSDCVRLVGSVPPSEMALWYSLGDLFVFASKSETQGMVILEAMSAGLPVVAVRASGVDDVIQQGYNGYQTPENRQQWRQKVQTLMEDAPLRQELSVNARRFAASYDIEPFARDVKFIYASVLAARARDRQ